MPAEDAIIFSAHLPAEDVLWLFARVLREPNAFAMVWDFCDARPLRVARLLTQVVSASRRTMRVMRLVCATF